MNSEIDKPALVSRQVRDATALASTSEEPSSFIYEKLIERQKRWYRHDERQNLLRDAQNRFVGTYANPFPFTQLDKLRERAWLDEQNVPMPHLRHVLPGDQIAGALEQIASDLPPDFAIKPVGAGHSHGVVLVRSGHDLASQKPFDPKRIGASLAKMAEASTLMHEGHAFAFNFSSFLVEDLVEDACGNETPTDYKIFTIGDRFLWLQLHFKEAGQNWVAFVDEDFQLLPEPAWSPDVCWRTHRALVCTDPAQIASRRPDCLPDILNTPLDWVRRRPYLSAWIGMQTPKGALFLEKSHRSRTCCSPGTFILTGQTQKCVHTGVGWTV